MTDDYKIKMSFSAEDYRKEYLEMKRFLPSEAEKVLKAVQVEFLEGYDKKSGTGKRGFGLAVASLFVFGGLAAIGGGIGSIFVETASSLMPVVGVAAGSLSMVIGSGVNDAMKERSFEKDKRLLNKIRADIETTDLIARFVEGRKIYGLPLPDGFEALSDEAMSRKYPAIVEARATSVPPMVMLNGPFNDVSEKPEVIPAAVSKRKPGGPSDERKMP